MSGLRRWWARRLSSRIFTLFFGLLLAVQLTVLVVVDSSVGRNARQLLAAELVTGQSVWEELLKQRAGTLTLGASVLAQDFGFRAAVNSMDIDTLRSALGNHGDRVKATVTAMLAPDLSLLAVAEGQDDAVARALQPLIPGLAQSGNALAVVGELPYQLVMAPVRSPLLSGYVVMGFALDQALLRDMKRVSGLDVVMLVRAPAGRERAPLATLAASDTGALLLHGAAGPELPLAAGPHLLRSMTPADGPGGRLRVVLLRAVADAVAPYRPLQATLAALTLAALALALVVSLATARRVTTPLRSLVRASERVGRGDYAQALEHTHREDEIGELARSFDHMRVSIASNEDAIRKLAFWDPLTGLPNRAQFRDAVQAAIAVAAQGHTPVAVVMLDLDRFKHVNDVLGYAFGDRLLKGVAARLAAHPLCRQGLVARLSGDEFALLLPRCGAVQALAVAEEVALVFHLPLKLDDHTVDVAAGFGVACFPEHAGDVDTLINHAEVAMYAAKRKTRMAMVYDPATDAASALTLSLLTELRHALEHDELRLFLQPKIALNGPRAGELVGAEALVRWQHPQRGMVPPMEFIPFAEQTGFVRQLTLWMLEATAREWPRLQALGLERVSVNLSTRDLMDQELPAKLRALLQRHPMPAQALCLEITESAIMDEPQRAEATLNALSEAGYKLSIDDFGTGYSSLAYLKRLPVDELKIDKSFVMAMGRDEDDAKIVRSTIDLAHNLGLTVVAEGVENAATLARLAALDCDEGQGYHMSRPLPAGEMTAFADQWAGRTPAAAPTARATPSAAALV
ncbi:MAG: GGDEF domain-containing protein [Leptothrix sp. (in: Bacteria)]|nr:GGDEF domain-containing protein [Leptothrix sp. (in: b-proteobacteria)]